MHGTSSDVTAQLRRQPPLAGRQGGVDDRTWMVRRPRRAFVLMGGDCAGTLRRATAMRLKIRTLLQMAVV